MTSARFYAHDKHHVYDLPALRCRTRDVDTPNWNVKSGHAEPIRTFGHVPEGEVPNCIGMHGYDGLIGLTALDKSYIGTTKWLSNHIHRSPAYNPLHCNRGLDPIPWTSSERWIRCPQWQNHRVGDPADASRMNSNSRPFV